MKPEKVGIWEWYKEDGTKVLVDVCNCGTMQSPWLRVYWWGGYYSVYDEEDPHRDKQWADRWGNYVGTTLDLVSKEDLYIMPTPEERTEIFAKVDADRKRL